MFEHILIYDLFYLFFTLNALINLYKLHFGTYVFFVSSGNTGAKF
jgi:hypothetical protein